MGTLGIASSPIVLEISKPQKSLFMRSFSAPHLLSEAGLVPGRASWAVLMKGLWGHEEPERMEILGLE